MNKKPTAENKELPYQAPYGYFEQLEERTLRKIKATPDQSTAWQGVGLAMRMGVLLVIFAFGWLLWQQSSSDEPEAALQPVLAAISTEERVAYLMNQGDPAAWMVWVEASDVEIETEWTKVEAEDWLENLSNNELEEIMMEL